MATIDPQHSKKPDPAQKPEHTPDFAEEAAPKTSEFATEKDAKDITGGEFDRVP